VCVVCRQVEVSATDRSLVQRSSTERVVFECVTVFLESISTIDISNIYTIYILYVSIVYIDSVNTAFWKLIRQASLTTDNNMAQALYVLDD
jgi:hypothetical protein